MKAHQCEMRIQIFILIFVHYITLADVTKLTLSLKTKITGKNMNKQTKNENEE